MWGELKERQSNGRFGKALQGISGHDSPSMIDPSLSSGPACRYWKCHPPQAHLTIRVMFDVTLNRHRLVNLLSITAAVLLAMHAILYIIEFQVMEVEWYVLQLFDVNEEHNLPTWFSGFNLGITTLFLWIISREKKRLDDSQSRRWTILFFGFFYLFVDEIAGLHETVNSVVEPSWAWGGLIIVLAVGLYFIPFLRSLPRHTFRQFVVAGAVFVGGAVIMELIGEPIDGDSLAYAMSTLVEEGMEMFGVILFTRAQLNYLLAGKAEAVISMRSD